MACRNGSIIKYELATPRDLRHSETLHELVRNQDIAGLAARVADGLDLDGHFEELRDWNQCASLVAHTVQQVARHRLYSWRGMMKTDHWHGSDTVALEWLLQAQADPNVQAVFIVTSRVWPFGQQVSPLHVALGFPCAYPWLEKEAFTLLDVVDLLVQHGANPHANASPGTYRLARKDDSLESDPSLDVIEEIRTTLSECWPGVRNVLHCSPNDVYVSRCHCGLRWRTRRILFLILYHGAPDCWIRQMLTTVELLHLVAGFL